MTHQYLRTKQKKNFKNFYRFAFSSQLQPIVDGEVRVELEARRFGVEFSGLGSDVKRRVVTRVGVALPPGNEISNFASHSADLQF